MSDIHPKAVYLYVFNNFTWIPIHWGLIEGDQVTFTDMGRGVVYLPAYYSGKDFTPVGDPFLIDDFGHVVSYKPDVIRQETLILKRKYGYSYNSRMLDGLFQGANRPDFSDCVELHRINQIPETEFQTIDIAEEGKFRYLRYIGDRQSFGNIAELEFYSKENGRLRKLSGDIIAIEGSYEEKHLPGIVFDGNTQTFFKIPVDSGAWVGLDLGKPQKIDYIRYHPRDDDNAIRVGDIYELFYWGEGKWNSLGKKVAEDKVLAYEHCPAGALYWLHNHTRGIEERIFTYDNDRQIWW